MAFKRSREASSSSPTVKRIRGASSLSSVASRWSYDVFLSFRGEDTRKSFTDHLYTALDQKGIRIFRDDEELSRGEDIASELLTAIEQSRISIIIFSKNYAFSRWCLDELVKLVQCKKTIGQMVVPVFYDVDPSNVRKQNGSFAEAFARHEERLKVDKEKVKKWREALTEAANSSGWDLRNVANGHESKFIQRIVEEVFSKLNQTPLNVAVYQVGIDSRVQDINLLLNVGFDDVRIVGIYGMGGIGKTTIAKAIYNLIFHKFDGNSFLANIGEISKQYNGLVRLQKQLLSDVLMKKKLAIWNSDRGINVIKERLCGKTVLIVLDDVDHLDQLNALAGKRDWFGLGSRIIITTRDEHLLNILEVDEKYGAKTMNYDESLQLFSWHAFKQDHPIEDYVELSNIVTTYAGGIPLALEVLGSFLFKRSMPEWKSVLEKFQRIPNDCIQEKLRVSYDALNPTEKVIFLDIACFFIGMNKDYAIKILDACGCYPEIGISVLVHRSLVTMNGGHLEMHGLLRDMGREIVRQESPMEPGERSRLWFHENVLDVLTKNTEKCISSES